MKKKLIITGIIITGVLIRLGYLVAPHMDSDQAIFGLQGMHVLKGEFPIFSWGTAYIGTLQTYIDAVFFYFFGPSRQVLNLVAVFFYIGYAFSLYYLTRSIFSKFTWRALTVLLGAIAPGFFVFHGIWGRHGYPETFCFGTLILALTCNNLEVHKKGRFYFILLLVAGIAWWTNFLVLYYFVPLVLFLLYKLYLSQNPGERFRILLFSISGFFLGSFPFWLYNIKNNFASLSMFGGGEGKYLEAWARVIQYFFPVLVGARQHGDWDYSFSTVSLVLTVFCALAFLFFLFYRGCLFFKSIFRKKLQPEDLLLTFLLTMCAVFLKSPYTHDPASVRYLIPFYSIYPVVLIYFIFLLSENFRLKKSAYLPVIFVLTMNFSSIWRESPFFQKQLRNSYQRDRAWQDGLFEKLKQKGKTKFVMYDYWRAAKFTFDAKEKLIFTHLNSRYPRYIYDMIASSSWNYLVGDNQALKKGMALLGYTYKQEKVEGYGYYIYTDFQRLFNNDYSVISPTKFTLQTSVNQQSLKNINDKNFSTAYSIKPLKEKGHVIDIRFPQPVELGGVTIFLKDRYLAPTHIKVVEPLSNTVLTETKDAFAGFKAGNYPYVPNAPPYMELFFKPYKANIFRIYFLKGTANWFPVKEILFFKAEVHKDLKRQDMFSYLADKKDYVEEVFCSMGALGRLEKALSRKIKYQDKQKINFKKRNLFVFEKEYLSFNIEQLTNMGIIFSYYEGKTFACILTQGNSWKEACWCYKAVFNFYDRKLAVLNYYKARKFKSFKLEKAVPYFEKAVFFLPTHYKALAFLTAIYQMAGDQVNFTKFKSALDSLYSAEDKLLADFESKIQLKGISLSRLKLKAGDIFEITYFLLFLKNIKLKNELYIFVHFLSKEKEILFQNDHKLDEKYCLLYNNIVDIHDPVSNKKLVEGEMLLDRNSVAVPGNLKYKGPVSIWFGIWNPKKEKRWSVTTDLESRSKAVKIGEITIE